MDKSGLDNSIMGGGIFPGMNSYPEPDEVLVGLGDKVTEGISRSVALAAKDLTAYRSDRPSWVAEHSERGLANWIHDRLWAHLTAQLDGHDGVTVGDGEPTREIIVGLTYRLRVKRHHEDGRVSTYATHTALEFFAQGVQDAFPGMEEVRLTAGYEWDPDSREIGEAVLSFRDGKDDVIWQIPLPDVGTGLAGTSAPLRPTTPEPPLPNIAVPAASEETSGEEKAT